MDCLRRSGRLPKKERVLSVAIRQASSSEQGALEQQQVLGCGNRQGLKAKLKEGCQKRNQQWNSPVQESKGQNMYMESSEETLLLHTPQQGGSPTPRPQLLFSHVHSQAAAHGKEPGKEVKMRYQKRNWHLWV